MKQSDYWQVVGVNLDSNEIYLIPKENMAKTKKMAAPKVVKGEAKTKKIPMKAAPKAAKKK